MVKKIYELNFLKGLHFPDEQNLCQVKILW